MTRPQKITFEEMRSSGVRGLLIYCSDHHCSHSIAISADRWPDNVRLSDLEPRFVCQACGRRGADVRPNFHGSGKSRSRRWAIVELFRPPLMTVPECRLNLSALTSAVQLIRALRYASGFGSDFKCDSHFFGTLEGSTDVSIFRTGIECN
jgi:hypothetical protein